MLSIATSGLLKRKPDAVAVEVANLTFLVYLIRQTSQFVGFFEIVGGLIEPQLVDRLQDTVPGATPGRVATEAVRLARPYGKDLTRLAEDSRWARHLTSRGRARDVVACLTLDAFALVPVYRPDVDKIVSPFG